MYAINLSHNRCLKIFAAFLNGIKTCLQGYQLLYKLRLITCWSNTHNIVTATCSGVTVLAAMLRSADQSCQETIAQCLWRRLKVLSHRQHSSSTSALRNCTGWTRQQRRLVESTSMDQTCSLRLFQAWVKCRRWQSTGWEKRSKWCALTLQRHDIGDQPTTDWPLIWKISNDDISATGQPIHITFGSWVGFSGSADRIGPFSVRINPRWSLPYTRVWDSEAYTL